MPLGNDQPCTNSLHSVISWLIYRAFTVFSMMALKQEPVNGKVSYDPTDIAALTVAP